MFQGKSVTLPLWVNVLGASAEWGCKPQAVIGEEDTPQSRLKWFLRWQIFADKRSRAMRKG